MKNSKHLLEALRSSYHSSKDLTIVCVNGQFLVSRILFSLILVPELQQELLNYEDAYFIIEVEKEVLENTVYNSFFSNGTVPKELAKKMPFIDWNNKFKLKVNEKSSQNSVNKILTTERNTSRNITTSASTAIDQKAELICKICGKILSDKKNLKKHIDVVHFNIRDHPHITSPPWGGGGGLLNDDI